MPSASRRSALRLLGTVVAGGGLGSLAGCFGGGITGGTLLTHNVRDQAHTVRVVALDDPFPPDTDAPGSGTPVGTPTPPWQRGCTVAVPVNEHVEHPNFVTEPGGYNIFARLDIGVTAMETHRFGTAAGGDGVTGGHIAVDIREDGELTIGFPHDD